jgi:adenylate cyclase class IV
MLEETQLVKAMSVANNRNEYYTEGPTFDFSAIVSVDIINVICNFLDLQSIISLSHTCSTLHKCNLAFVHC